jgi:spermidine/putrescine transport system ATP-binding protein
MNKGRIEDIGPPLRVYLRPASLFAATFMGESNVIAGRVQKSAGGKLVVDTALGRVLVDGQGAEGEAVHLCIRPEQLDLSPDARGADVALGRARVSERSFQGTHLRLHAVSDVDATTELLLRLSVDKDVAVGATIEVYARAGDVVVLRG